MKKANHNLYMQEALKEAERALADDEVPVGAVIVHNGRIIGRAHNQKERLHDPTAHAEMIAITQAAEALGSWRLAKAVMYVTLEPCPMCAGALVQARLPVLVYGAKDPKAGACGSLFNIVQDKRLNHQIEIIPGIMEDECRIILKEFFTKQRIKFN
jgi:tRNA(adenine34) deaminase